ncbi:hypothetical protein [Cognatiluteimonas profundi]|uniref:hypothetical protein n=1 Tax=Cognatiluteimonas profundi TaxID=2594501 RepID=UPI00131BFE71|nr:hypothetical protein [Lysobacter profundi]
MATRSNGPLAGFDWLKRGINVGYGNPKALFGGAAFLLLLCLLPTVITMPMQFGALRTGTPASPATFGWIMAISAIGGLLLVPLYAGYLRVIDAAERGLPVRARDIFQPYRQGDALRLIGYGLAMAVVYIAAFGAVIAATGGGIARWYMQAMTAQANHQPPPTTLPDGFGVAFALFLVVGLFMMGVYAISLGQVALGRRSVFGAIGDGLLGAVKNVLPLLVFVVSSVVAWIVLAIVVVLLVGLFALLGKLVGAWLVMVLMVLMIPLYLAMMLTLFAVMFGVMYYLWRDVCGDDSVPAAAQSIAA